MLYVFEKYICEKSEKDAESVRDACHQLVEGITARNLRKCIIISNAWILWTEWIQSNIIFVQRN